MEISFFGQLISFIDENIIDKCAKKCNSDYYVKRFMTKDHLTSMLFCVTAKCSSLFTESGTGFVTRIKDNADRVMFKQLKQNFPLKYFLGGNENAVKIQIYCALIANLPMAAVQTRLKRHWSFSNLVSFCKIHLFHYIHLFRFLENPEKNWLKTEKI